MVAGSSVLERVDALVDLSDLERYHGDRVAGLVEAVEAVAGVHGVPAGFPGVRVEVWSEVAGGACGAYSAEERLIRLSEDSCFGASTLVHELGHHFSLSLSLSLSLSSGDFVGEVYSNPWLLDMYAAVRASKSWELVKKSEDRLYLSDVREVFARAYGQWTAERSGSVGLLAELEMVRAMSPEYQWASGDFDEIGKAMDGFFLDKGWVG